MTLVCFVRDMGSICSSPALQLSRPSVCAQLPSADESCRFKWHCVALIGRTEKNKLRYARFRESPDFADSERFAGLLPGIKQPSLGGKVVAYGQVAASKEGRVDSSGAVIRPPRSREVLTIQPHAVNPEAEDPQGTAFQGNITRILDGSALLRLDSTDGLGSSYPYPSP